MKTGSGEALGKASALQSAEIFCVNCDPLPHKHGRGPVCVELEDETQKLLIVSSGGVRETAMPKNAFLEKST